MMAAKRPYIYTGGGVPLSNASQELHPGGHVGYPCTNTLMGLGATPPVTRNFWACSACMGRQANNAMQIA
jgi:acetolactate synthase-1/2/3 large subunit